MIKYLLKEHISFRMGDEKFKVFGIMISHYDKNDAMAVLCNIVDPITGQDEIYKLSVNITDRVDQLKNDQFFLKDWSENSSLASALLDAGIVVLGHGSVHTGWVTSQIATLDMSKMDPAGAPDED